MCSPTRNCHFRSVAEREHEHDCQYYDKGDAYVDIGDQNGTTREINSPYFKISANERYQEGKIKTLLNEK